MIEKKRTIREAIDFAIANCEIEGFVYTEEEKKDFKKIKNGQMTIKEMHKKVDQQIAQDRKEHPEWFATEGSV